jgi:hypothetical protein
MGSQQTEPASRPRPACGIGSRGFRPGIQALSAFTRAARRETLRLAVF